MLNKTLVSLFFLFASVNTQAKDIETDVIEVLEYGSKSCTCGKPEDLDRLCIMASSWTTPPLNEDSEKTPITGFKAEVSGDYFKFYSSTYFLGCNYDKTPAIFTDPAKNELFKNFRYYDFYGYKGAAAYMTVVLENKSGHRRTFERVNAKILEEKFYVNVGTPEENYRIHYRTEASITLPLEYVLTPTEERLALDGIDQIKTLKVTFSVEKQTGLMKKFGEYTIRARFFKQGTKIIVSVSRV